MAHQIRDRLRRIREMKRDRAVSAPVNSGVSASPPRLDGSETGLFQDWIPSGFQTLKRVFDMDMPVVLPEPLPPALSILIPDVRFFAEDTGGSIPAPEDLLFFDLETTGLSGGAGTVAFLAAFGRLVRSAAAPARSVRVTQYLLLDYPGENDFLQALLGEFDGGRSVILSYNGKSFDSQILKTRCLMNGIRPPEYCHADLLHPSRRLWKRITGDCSQGTIEQAILGIDRRGDTPGALAPEIWFSFLKTGAAAPLLGVCDHNRRDIAGLAAIFAAMSRIAFDPFEAPGGLNFDVESLALRWWNLTRRGRTGETGGQALRDTGTALLRFAALQGCPRAALAYARNLIREGAYDEGRERLSAIAEAGCPADLRIAALRTLAVDSEWRLADAAGALKLVNRALKLLPAEAASRNEFGRRAERLARKAENAFACHN